MRPAPILTRRKGRAFQLPKIPRLSATGSPQETPQTSRASPARPKARAWPESLTYRKRWRPQSVSNSLLQAIVTFLRPIQKQLDLKSFVDVPGQTSNADGGVSEPTDFDAPVTDLDLARPDASSALAVIRDFRTVVKLPIPDAFEDSAQVSTVVVENEIIGSVSIAQW